MLQEQGLERQPVKGLAHEKPPDTILQLLETLYSKCREELIAQIRQDEKQYKQYLQEIEEIGRGEWDSRLLVLEAKARQQRSEEESRRQQGVEPGESRPTSAGKPTDESDDVADDKTPAEDTPETKVIAPAKELEDIDMKDIIEDFPAAEDIKTDAEAVEAHQDISVDAIQPVIGANLDLSATDGEDPTAGATPRTTEGRTPGAAVSASDKETTAEAEAEPEASPEQAESDASPVDEAQEAADAADTAEDTNDKEETAEPDAEDAEDAEDEVEVVSADEDEAEAAATETADEAAETAEAEDETEDAAEATADDDVSVDDADAEEPDAKVSESPGDATVEAETDSAPQPDEAEEAETPSSVATPRRLRRLRSADQSQTEEPTEGEDEDEDEDEAETGADADIASDEGANDNAETSEYSITEEVCLVDVPKDEAGSDADEAAAELDTDGDDESKDRKDSVEHDTIEVESVKEGTEEIETETKVKEEDDEAVDDDAADEDDAAEAVHEDETTGEQGEDKESSEPHTEVKSESEHEAEAEKEQGTRKRRTRKRAHSSAHAESSPSRAEPSPSTPQTQAQRSSAGASSAPPSASNRKFQNLVTPLLSNISSNRSASFFTNPVSENDAPDYYELIYEPTDLRTIKAMVKDGRIQNTSELEREILRMFANAVMYNRWGSDISIWTREMERETETLISVFRGAERKGMGSSDASGMESSKRRKKG
ncbi:uncharacterized protein V1510DRAFT_413064 [Dipodascopsis tothii]|uniref:uncharacterized protein n=1 Tax=Dipodascopsis tothii TaxID=44089 RepID=UPI0034CFAA86